MGAITTVAQASAAGAYDAAHGTGAYKALPDSPTSFPTPNVAAATKASTDTTTAATNLGNTQTGGSTPFVASSAPAVTSEDLTKKLIDGLNTNNDSLTNAHANYVTQLQSQMDALTQRRIAQDKEINDQFDQTKADTINSEKNETGAETVALQRAGGYLGEGASQPAAINNLTETHIADLNKLETQRQAALTSANNAIDDKDFALAQAQAEDAKSLESDINTRKQTYFDNVIKIQNQMTTDTSVAQKQADDTLTKLSTLAPDDIKKLDPSTLAGIDKVYGVPGFAQKYLDVTSAANQVKGAKDAMAFQQTYLNFLQDIPAGQSVTMPDGTKYTGIGKTADISTFQEVDDAGRITVYNYNKGNGQLTKTDAGYGGKTKSLSPADQEAETATRLTAAQSAFDKLSHPVDPHNKNSPAYVSGSDYISLYQGYIRKNPGKGPEFITNFPPNKMVVPGDVNGVSNSIVRGEESGF